MVRANSGNDPGSKMSIDRRSVLGALGASIPMTVAFSSDATAEVPSGFSRNDIKAGHVCRNLVYLRGPGGGAVLDEAGSKYVLIRTTPPLGKSNPSPGSFGLDLGDEVIRPLKHTLEIYHDDDVLITHELRGESSKHASRHEVLDSVIFKVPVARDVSTSTLFARDARTEIDVPVDEVLATSDSVGQPLTVENIVFPESLGESETASITFELTNPGNRPSLLRAAINVSGLWHATYPVEVAVSGSKTVERTVEIPDIADDSSEERGTISVATPDVREERSYTR